MRIELTQTLQLECTVCKQSYDDEHMRETAQLDVTFGHVDFAVCPCCRQSVEDNKDRNYQLRAKRFVEKQQGKTRAWKIHKLGLTERWYDTHHRCWFVRIVDEHGDQIAECENYYSKREAVDAQRDLARGAS